MADEQSTTAPPALEVRLSSDKLRLLVTVADPHGNLSMAANRIAMELPSLELAEPPSIEQILTLLGEACAPGEDLVEFPLLEGQMPVPPRHGELTWQQDYFATGFSVDGDNDQVDYWERAEHRSVKAGELLAVLVQPREGEPGVNLQGGEAPVEKASAERLRAGKGVRVDDTPDVIHYFADVDGRISLKDGTVSVDNVFAVNGNVSLETGNIHHAGVLVISGDVCEGATVEADGDILIKGMVEPSTIICGGDLTVGGGIVGDDDHEIRVEGSVQARYLNDVTLRCGGDLNITSQLDHSRVASLGKINAPRARVAGGMLVVYQGGQIGHAGAAGATGTEILIGTHWAHEEQRVVHEETMHKLQEAHEKLAGAVTSLVQAGGLDDDRRESVLALQAKQKRIENAMHTESEAQRQKDEEIAAGGQRQLAVQIATFPGVTFRIAGSATTSDRPYDMPRLIALRRNKVRILPMGDLNQPE